MDTVLTFQVQVNADNVEEPPEVFFVDVTATRTAIISTPRVPITICGSTCFFHTCNISHLCNLFLLTHISNLYIYPSGLVRAVLHTFVAWKVSDC